MNLPLLIVCIAAGIATYHVVVTILLASVAPRSASPARSHASVVAKDAERTKSRMAKAVNRHRRLQGIV